MSITLPCPRCEYTIRAAETAAGTTILCPSCRGRVAVPAAQAPARPEPDEADDGWDGDERPAKPKRSATNRPLLIGGGVALLAIVGMLLMLGIFAARNRAQDRAAFERAEFEMRRQQQFMPPPGVPLDDAGALAVLDAQAGQWPEIPQDAARTAKLRAARLEWSRKTMDRAFDRAGRIDQPWAGKARNALALKAAELATHPEFALPLQTGDATAEALSAAVAAGCDDPLVLYYRSNLFRGDGVFPVAMGEARTIARRVWESNYPDVQKMSVAHNLLVALGARGAPADEMATWDKRFWEAYGRAARDADAVTQDHVIELAHQREDLTMQRGGTRTKAYDEVAAALQRADAPEYTRLVVRGGFLINHAWDARGGGPIDTVTPEMRRLFQERLSSAGGTLTTAYELDPDRPHAPTLMITVCKGRELPRAEMERWFERAMRADPDNYQACGAKLEFLHPKWGGTPEEHLGFAWQCVRTGNTVGMLPYAAVVNISANTPLPEPIPPGWVERVQAEYGEPRVWRVLDAALTKSRADRPELRWLRAEHVRYACAAGRIDTAVRLLADVADHRAGGFDSADQFAYYREWAKTGRPPRGP